MGSVLLVGIKKIVNCTQSTWKIFIKSNFSDDPLIFIIFQRSLWNVTFFTLRILDLSLMITKIDNSILNACLLEPWYPVGINLEFNISLVFRITNFHWRIAVHFYPSAITILDMSHYLGMLYLFVDLLKFNSISFDHKLKGVQSLSCLEEHVSRPSYLCLL
jgi:hypothetical protein